MSLYSYSCALKRCYEIIATQHNAIFQHVVICIQHSSNNIGHLCVVQDMQSAPLGLSSPFSADQCSSKISSKISHTANHIIFLNQQLIEQHLILHDTGLCTY